MPFLSPWRLHTVFCPSLSTGGSIIAAPITGPIYKNSYIECLNARAVCNYRYDQIVQKRHVNILERPVILPKYQIELKLCNVYLQVQYLHYLLSSACLVEYTRAAKRRTGTRFWASIGYCPWYNLRKHSNTVEFSSKSSRNGKQPSTTGNTCVNNKYKRLLILISMLKYMKDKHRF